MNICSQTTERRGETHPMSMKPSGFDKLMMAIIIAFVAMMITLAVTGKLG